MILPGDLVTDAAFRLDDKMLCIVIACKSSLYRDDKNVMLLLRQDGSVCWRYVNSVDVLLGD